METIRKGHQSRTTNVGRRRTAAEIEPPPPSAWRRRSLALATAFAAATGIALLNPSAASADPTADVPPAPPALVRPDAAGPIAVDGAPIAPADPPPALGATQDQFNLARQDLSVLKDSPPGQNVPAPVPADPPSPRMIQGRATVSDWLGVTGQVTLDPDRKMISVGGGGVATLQPKAEIGIIRGGTFPQQGPTASAQASVGDNAVGVTVGPDGSLTTFTDRTAKVGPLDNKPAGVKPADVLPEGPLRLSEKSTYGPNGTVNSSQGKLVFTNPYLGKLPDVKITGEYNWTFPISDATLAMLMKLGDIQSWFQQQGQPHTPLVAPGFGVAPQPDAATVPPPADSPAVPVPADAPAVPAPADAPAVPAPADAPAVPAPVDAPAVPVPADAPAVPAPVDAPAVPAPADAPAVPAPVDAPAVPAPADAPAVPAPADAPAVPAPVDAPAVPAPVDAPAVPAPVDAPAVPAPVDAPAAPAPVDAPAAPAPVEAPAAPAPVEAPAAPAPVEAPAAPAPVEAPAAPAPVEAPAAPAPIPAPVIAPPAPVTNDDHFGGGTSNDGNPSNDFGGTSNDGNSSNDFGSGAGGSGADIGSPDAPGSDTSTIDTGADLDTPDLNSSSNGSDFGGTDLGTAGSGADLGSSSGGGDLGGGSEGGGFSGGDAGGAGGGAGGGGE